jgi:ribonucleoside-triphosphate reductase
MGYFNSIGGTALEVGSIKVNTINLARIAYENSKDEYLKALEEKIILNLKCLDVVRGIITRNIEKGLLPNYSLDIMSMESQYNTIGVIGIY